MPLGSPVESVAPFTSPVGALTGARWHQHKQPKIAETKVGTRNATRPLGFRLLPNRSPRKPNQSATLCHEPVHIVIETLVFRSGKAPRIPSAQHCPSKPLTCPRLHRSEVGQTTTSIPTAAASLAPRREPFQSKTPTAASRHAHSAPRTRV